MRRFNQLLIFASIIACSISCETEPFIKVPFFQLNYSFEAEGGTTFASIGSSSLFTAVSDADWCYVEAYDHKNNNLRISVEENTLASERKATITLELTDADSQTITIVQDASDPFITLTTKSVTLDANTYSFTVIVKANTGFSFSLPSWIKNDGTNTPGIGENTFHFVADALIAGKRTDNIVFSSTDGFPVITATVPVTQTNEVLPLLDESFEWAVLADGATTTVGSTANEVKITKYADTEGWTSNERCWSRGGYFRMGQTGYAGSLTTPALSGLPVTADVVVTFKAARWVSSAGALDYYHEFSIVVEGSGKASKTSFSIENYSGSNILYASWQDNPEAERSFVISGAASDTKITFIGGPSETLTAPSSGVTNIGRVFIDDVKVEYDY